MDRIIGEVFGRALVEVIGMGISAAARSLLSQSSSNRSTTTKRKQNRSLPTPLAPPIHHERAVLITASTITFGNDCERLVNIAFHTSQTFPSIIATWADFSSYLRKELAKQYPSQHFHIVVGENQGFGFSVDDGEYFAEIEQKRYRVLIFSTKQNDQTKSDIHEANSQLALMWH
jgi:hypothetical protein